ncbi:dihydrodipicolinate synthase family protein [Sulfuriroseicoccus oceanibius]|uniref:Dihydrodipicolinate synthase family protein n=1 Tax=Sulfuriroseicoccus oceanibius TaxID=2707525 RepID=A0A6B3L989_9BACT|nr:dihydrodipicolinate synthase family protein [Sulfuriroseicoccus oceanibius]QQL44275.1 dihydrodipicolinate synthase family protein [Sulfuriroseicoccus oceanibius]
MNPLNIDGLVAATVTPMHADGSVNYDLIAPQIDYLVDQGIKGAYILGSTGEGMLLTDDERKKVAEKFVTLAGDRLPIFVQVGHNSWQAAADLAAHAESLGAAAVSATSPGYFKPDNAQSLVDGVKEVTDAAPNTPFYYYHIPALSGVSVDIIEAARLSKEQLPTFTGIKYSDGSTFYNLPLLQEAAPGCEFFAGSDEAYLMSVAQGFKGAVGSTYGYGKVIYDNVRKHVEAGEFEEARMWQARALSMITTFFSTCGRSGIKGMWSAIGLPMGASRNPIASTTPEQIDALRKGLEQIGFYDWAAQQVVSK